MTEYGEFVKELTELISFNEEHYKKYKSNEKHQENRNRRETERMILKILQEKEDKSNNKYKYWYHNEYDSNVSGFEYMMNNKLICVKTKLKGKDLKVLMGMFMIIFDGRQYDYKFKSEDSKSILEEVLEFFDSDECCIGGENYSKNETKK